MPDDFDPGYAAAGIAAAWQSGAQPADLRNAVRPPTLAAAYDIQDRLIAHLGYPVTGWKIGLAGRNAYRGAGLERPIFGRVLAPRCFASRDIVPVPGGIDVTVELELALIIADDVGPRTPVTADLIRSAHLGFEIVCSRLPDRAGIGVLATIADNAVSHAVVLGDAIDFDRFPEIAAAANIGATGQPATVALHGDDLPDPLSVLGHLVAHLGERGETLRRGSVVFTGTLTKPFDIAAPAEIIGSGPAPSVHCRLAPGL